MNVNSIDSYIAVSDEVSVKKIKCDSILYNSISDAIKNRSNPQTSTVLYTKYENVGTKTGINAEYYSPSSLLNGNIYMVYRKDERQDYYDFVCQIKGYNSFQDFNIRAKSKYHYLVTVPRKMESNGEYQYYYYENLEDDNSTQRFEEAKWDTWSICTIEELIQEDQEYDEDIKTIYEVTSNVWTLGLNMEEPTISQNINVTSWDTLSKYPRFSMGQRNYQSSSFTSLLGKIQEWEITEDGKTVKNCRYTERELNDETNFNFSKESDKMRAWKEFISDGELKLLKDNKGNSWIVYIVDTPTLNMKTMSTGMPTVISFNWKEAEEIDDVSIVKLGG